MTNFISKTIEHLNQNWNFFILISHLKKEILYFSKFQTLSLPPIKKNKQKNLGVRKWELQKSKGN